MPAVFFLVSVVALLHVACCIGLPAASTCQVEADDPCKCKGVNFTLDISHYLHYPVFKIPDLSPPGYDVYDYTYSPCKPISCTSGGKQDAYGCQYGYNHTYVMARKTPVQWIIDKWNPLQFTAQWYTDGDSFATRERLMQVTFLYENKSPVIVMQNNTETPKNFTYNFYLTGNVVKIEKF